MRPLFSLRIGLKKAEVVYSKPLEYSPRPSFQPIVCYKGVIKEAKVSPSISHCKEEQFIIMYRVSVSVSLLVSRVGSEESFVSSAVWILYCYAYLQ